MTVHSERAGQALAHLGEADPALAALALWIAHRDGAPMRSDGATIYYDAGFALRPLPEQVGLAGHHILHVAFRHTPRMAAMQEREGARFDARRFNLAADVIVNEALLAAEHALPRPAVRLSDLLALLGEPAEAAATALADWDVERLYLALGAREAQGGGETESYARAKAFAPDLAPDADRGGEDPEAADWQGHLSRALEAGRQAGRGIGRLAGALGDLPAPHVPWERQLRGLVARALGHRPQHAPARPARRWIAREAQARAAGSPTPGFEPALARDGARPRIAVGLDTSGSVEDDMLTLFAAELAGLAGRTGAETHLLAFDETVQETRLLPPTGIAAALRARPLRRGGGTSFVEVLTQAEALRPAITVVLTDLDGVFPPRPGTPVVWATPHAPLAPPPFGRVLVMDR
ncbi:hypothetical protein DRV85_10950 [Rhodosalinus halophilus]|uniref:Metal-dependent peptidase n=1 Tax=Rhodosalinus halophilus TaxID=2259333 RepID=A0A365U8P6_9RHOB|nr:VWA-like domain-containing protein [Rhodosalinus halophilus]RBI85161.1 hypothetical protein DRV85_10950 [Rhodosalinus halophilus]